MSWIDSLSSIASNVGLGKLAPANSDAVKDAYKEYRRQSTLAGTSRAASREAANKKGGDHFEQTMVDHNEKAEAAVKLGNHKNAALHKTRGDGYATAVTNFRTAKGLKDGDTLDSTELTKEQLDSFRKLNREDLVNAQKNQKKAVGDLKGHAKDYYFSDDLGANAMRWGATAAAYGGVAVGARAITGGSATTNNQGQRDIAGIPFF